MDPEIQEAMGGIAPPAAADNQNLDPEIQEAMSQGTAAGKAPYAGLTQTKEALGILGRHPFTAGIGMLENAASGVGGTIGKLVGRYADLTGGTPNTYAQKLEEAATYQPRTEAGKEIQSLGAQQAASLGKAAGNIPGANTPLGQTLGEAIPEAATDIAGVLGIRGAIKGGGPEGVTADHPLAAATQAQIQRLQGLRSRAQAVGLDLPESGSADRLRNASSNNTPVVRDVVRQEMQLHPDAPVERSAFEGKGGAFDTYVKPAYDAVRNDPKPITLGPDYANSQVELLKGSRAQFDPTLTPPAGGKISGADAVRYSQDARTEARALYKQADGPMGTTSMKAQADLYKQSAENLEDAVSRHYAANGQSDVGANWDAARTYAAKAHDYMDAMDGAGNVNLSVLAKKMNRQGKPLSGDQEMLADMGARYPEATKITRETAPRPPGLIRRIATRAGPIVGGAIGGAAAGGLGAAAGAGVGEYVSEKFNK